MEMHNGLKSFLEGGPPLTASAGAAGAAAAAAADAAAAVAAACCRQASHCPVVRGGPCDDDYDLLSVSVQ